MTRRQPASSPSRSAIRTPGRAWNQCAPGAVFCSMETHALRSYSQRAAMPRWLIVGFIAGALAVIVFHQSALAVLHALQLSRSAPYSFSPTAPLGIPQLWSLAFWGGVWGIVLAAVLARVDGARLIAAA